MAKKTTKEKETKKEETLLDDSLFEDETSLEAAEEPIVDLPDVGDEDEEPLETLAQIEADMMKRGKAEGFVDAEELRDRTMHLGLTDQQIEDILEKFRAAGIKTESDDDEKDIEEEIPADFNELSADVDQDDAEDIDGLDEEAISDIPENIRISANKSLPNYSKITKVEIVLEPFAKTPKMSIKRFLYK